VKTTPINVSTPQGRDMGLVDDVRWDFFERKRAAIAAGSANPHDDAEFARSS
jgi:hypothetical protein